MNYDDLTHRGLTHLINSPEPSRLTSAKSLWDTTAQTAWDLADVIQARLERLTSPDGGWTGSGAEAFKQAVTSELIDNLRAYALQAGGHHKQGEQNTGYDHQVKTVLDAVNDSHTTAQQHSVPWDVDPQWQADLPPKPDPDDKPKPGEPAKPDEPVKIRNGSGGVVKEVDKKEWESLISSTPASAPSYNGPLKVSVSGSVHQADQLFEAVGLDTAPKAAARQAVTSVVAALDHFAPAPVSAAKTSGTDYAGKTSSAPGPGGPGHTPGGTPGRPPHDVPHHPTDDTPGHTPGETPGGDPGETPTGYTPGDGIDPYDPTQPPHDGTTPSTTGGSGGAGNGFGGIQTGTTAAGVNGGLGGVPGGVPGGVSGGGVPGGVPAGVGAGGVGAGGVGGTGMVGVGAPGAAGLGSFGGGGSGAGATFAPGGPGGRGLVSAGNVGSVGPSSGPGGSAAGGSGAGAGGAGGGGVAPVSRRRTDSEDEEQSADLDSTWLEEDDSVWGSRAGAPPAEIR